MGGAHHPAPAGAGYLPAGELRGGADAGAGNHDAYPDAHSPACHADACAQFNVHVAAGDDPDGYPLPVTNTVTGCALDGYPDGDAYP